ncbi:MAG: MMPL family transporter [Actinomycetota bacterium]|nr:MMPL family transporter [Actinomycetota bacterium]
MHTASKSYRAAVDAYLRWVTGRRSKWLVVAIGVALAGALGPLAGKLGPLEDNSPASFLPAGAASTKVAAFQASQGGGTALPAIVVFSRPGGLKAEDRLVIARARTAVAARLGASVVGGLQVSPNQVAAVFNVAVPTGAGSSTVAARVAAIRRVVSRFAAPATSRPRAGALQVAVGGPAGTAADARNAFAGIDGTLLIVTASIVALLLLLIYKSPILWLVPLASVGLAASWAQGAAYGLARAGFTINGMVVGILSVLVFGAGTDYALLLVARYREELQAHEDHHQAMAVALRRAGPAIVTSALTVILALVCLLLAQLSDVAALGPACAAGIACALVAQLAFLPALLCAVGRKAFWPFVPRKHNELRRDRPGAWVRLGGALARRPRRVWVGLTLLLVACSLGLLGYRGGVDQQNGFRSSVGSVAAQALVNEDFPAASAAPAVVLVRPASEAPKALAAARATPGIVAVGAARRRGGAALFDARLSSSPGSPAAQQTIERLRARLWIAAGSGALVGGESATNLDLSLAAARDRAVLIPVIVVVVALMLGLLLRAVVAPVVLVASVVLSYLASLGVSTLVFVHVFGFVGFDPSVPIFGFVFLVALGVDYNIFLMARAREEVASGRERGISRALGVTGSVVTSAGVVLAATFAVLGVLPLVALTEVGFLVAFGVLLDTFLVRSALVPALAIDLGPSWWWPSSLTRRASSSVPARGAPRLRR